MQQWTERFSETKTCRSEAKGKYCENKETLFSMIWPWETRVSLMRLVDINVMISGLKVPRDKPKIALEYFGLRFQFFVMEFRLEQGL